MKLETAQLCSHICLLSSVWPKRLMEISSDSLLPDSMYYVALPALFRQEQYICSSNSKLCNSKDSKRKLLEL